MGTAHNQTPAGHAALRRGRTSIPGQVYLLSFTTHGRQPLFADPLLALPTSAAMTDRRLWVSSQLLAWVLMPDHCHVLLGLGGLEYLPSLVQRLKTNTARHVRQAAPGIKQVWAKAYHDHAVRDGEDMVAVARYVICNPVRAGIVRRVGDYPFWDAVWVGG